VGRTVLVLFAVLAIIAVTVVLITPWDDGVDSLAGTQHLVELVLVPCLILMLLPCNEIALRAQSAAHPGGALFVLTCVLLC
jgi:hypothetical protein